MKKRATENWRKMIRAEGTWVPHPRWVPTWWAQGHQAGGSARDKGGEVMGQGCVVATGSPWYFIGFFTMFTRFLTIVESAVIWTTSWGDFLAVSSTWRKTWKGEREEKERGREKREEGSKRGRNGKLSSENSLGQKKSKFHRWDTGLAPSHSAAEQKWTTNTHDAVDS